MVTDTQDIKEGLDFINGVETQRTHWILKCHPVS